MRGKKINKEGKYYTGIFHENTNSAEKKLSYFAKDNFWTRDFATTASSSFLTDFLPSQNAFIIELLTKKKVLVGKVVLDEFACGGTGLYANSGSIFNPHNSLHIVGGSSSGSAWVVAKDLVPFSLGHDTGDSVRRPAAYCGIIGFKPSYGRLSRAGIIPMASSLDTVGILARKISDIKSVFDIVSQKDAHDLLTYAFGTKKSPLLLKKTVKKEKKIAIIADLETHLSSSFAKIYHNTIEKLRELGYIVEKITIPKKIREHLQITYLILCSTELVSHLNSLQGVTYGIKENISISHKRSKYLGPIVKQRLLIGAYFLARPKLLTKAQKMRFLVNKWVKKVFQNYEFLVFPSTNSPAPPVTNFQSSQGENSEQSPFTSGLITSHWSDNLLLLANFAGLPSLSLPIGSLNGLPVSININGDYGNDEKVLDLTEKWEKMYK